MSWFVAGAVVVGTAYSIYSAEQQAGAMEDKAEFDLAMSRLNGERAEADAAEVRRGGETDKVRAIGASDTIKDSQAAMLATQDVSATSGAGANLIAESNLNSKLNMIDIGYNAFMNSAKYKREANQTRAQGQIDYVAGRTNASNTRISGYANAVNMVGNYAAKSGGGGKE